MFLTHPFKNEIIIAISFDNLGFLMTIKRATLGDLSELVYVIIIPSAGADILRILIFTRQHGLTRFTCFHGPYQMFYFCVRCHTVCLLTRINIEGHYTLYSTF